MDVPIILSLLAGAVPLVANSSIARARQKLKSLIESHAKDSLEARHALSEYDLNVQLGRQRLEEVLIRAGAEQDPAIEDAATELESLIRADALRRESDDAQRDNNLDKGAKAPAAQYRPDITISDSLDSPVAVIEVKAIPDLDIQDATRYVQSLMSRGLASRVQFVMLVTPVTGYLWTTPAKALSGDKPDIEFPMAEITERYLPPAGHPLRGVVFELLIQEWLSDLAAGNLTNDEVTKTLSEAGFLRAIRDRRVNTQPAWT